MSLKLSVLDQSPIHDGKEAKFGLFDSIELSKLCDELGYYRYWCAEHHDTPGYASASPEIMVSAIANATSKIRVGSGGVMLNHYSAYKVAEQFKTLNSLYENRIDLGIGRASGANFLSARALHNGHSEHYEKKAYYLTSFLNNTIADDDYFHGVEVSPKGADSPPVFLLGSSDGSSYLASQLGVGFCLALFIGTHERPIDIISNYKKNFVGSKNFKVAKPMIAVACICAETKEKAQEIASSHTFWKVQAFRHTKRDGLFHPEKVKEFYKELSIEDKSYFHETMETMILGTPKECKEKIEQLADMYGVEEIMVVNVTYSFEDRKRSYELLANEFNLNGEKNE